MSTEPYPEVSVDESGIVPPQGGRTPEWPKKIRTLTATELDRLTIDGAGRFYWDGKLVNYEPPEGDRPARLHDPLDRLPSDMVDRPAYDAGDDRTHEQSEGGENDGHERALAHLDHRDDQDRHDAHDLDVRPVRQHQEHHDAPQADVQHALASQLVRIPERIRISLTRWQSVGAVIVVLGVMVGALGVAAYGFVASHEWGCRTGLIESHCPAMQGVPSSRRPDIPA